MERTAHTNFIAGATCPFCGVHFGEKWGKAARNNVKNLALPIKTNTGRAYMKMRVCREHLFTDEDFEWLVECHKLWYQTYQEDAQGNRIVPASVAAWSLDKQAE